MYDGLGTLLGTIALYGLVIVLAVGLGLGVAWHLIRTRRKSYQEFQERHTTRTNMGSSINIGNVRSGGESRVTMNGMTFVIKGGRVTVNGQPWGPVGEDGAAVPLAEPPKVILNQDGTITGPIQGDLIIEGPGPVTLIVKGDVHGAVDVHNGNVECSAVRMGVDAGGNVTCGNVGMGVDAGGNVTCGNVGLSVEAGGNVYRK